MADDRDSKDGDRLESGVEEVIAAFGGIRPLANRLGLAASTVQGWKERGHIPESRHAAIEKAARDADIQLDPAWLSAEDEGDDGASEDEAAPAPVSEAEAKPDVDVGEESAPESAPTAATEAMPEAPAQAAALGGETAHQRGNGRAFLLGAAVLAAGIVIAVVARDAWLPMVEEERPMAGPSEETLEALEARVEALIASVEARVGADDLSALRDSLEERLSALRADLEAAADGGGDPELADRIAALEAELQEARQAAEAGAQSAQDALAEIETLRDQPAETLDTEAILAPVRAELKAMDERLAALEDQVAALAKQRNEALERRLRNVSLALALDPLRRAVASGKPYASELQRARGILESAGAADTPELMRALKQLDASAETGVLTVSTLERRFKPLIGKILTAEAESDESADWIDHFVNRVSRLVSVRPLPEVADGSTVADRVARAEGALAKGNLAQAAAELSALSGAPRQAADPWLAKARQRLAAEEAIERLEEGLAERLSQASQG